MKKLCVLLALILALTAFAGCAGNKPAELPADTAAPEATDPAQEPTESALEPAAQTAEPTEAPSVEAEYIDDFTVRCIDGSSFTLSEALRDHELVLINLFFTGCGPCGMEFPYLQEAWEMNSDKIAVIALTPDPDDTDEILNSYAKELGLTFPIAHEDGTGLRERFVQAYPTSILVDRSFRVAALEIGAKTSLQEFLDWFEGYTGDNYDPTVCTYTVFCYDCIFYDDIVGVVFNFCSDTACFQVTADETGKAVFTGPAARYHVEVYSIPDGLRLYDDPEWTTEPYSQTFWVAFSAAGD